MNDKYSHNKDSNGDNIPSVVTLPEPGSVAAGFLITVDELKFTSIKSKVFTKKGRPVEFYEWIIVPETI